MGILAANNAYGTLASGISGGDTTISLTTGHGARFPLPSGGDYFYATLVDISNNLEIVKVTARTNDSLTVVRGQDGTNAQAFSSLDRIECRPVAAMFNDTVGALSGIKSAAYEDVGQAPGEIPVNSEVVHSGGDALTGGYTSAASYDLGTISGTVTLDPANGNFQHCSKNGNGTIEAPTAAGVYTIILQVTNTSGTGSLSLSSFTKVTGDSLAGANGNKYIIAIAKTANYVVANVQALQ